MNEWKIIELGKVDDYFTNSFCGRESTSLKEKWLVFSSVYTT